MPPAAQRYLERTCDSAGPHCPIWRQWTRPTQTCVVLDSIKHAPKVDVTTKMGVTNKGVGSEGKTLTNRVPNIESSSISSDLRCGFNQSLYQGYWTNKSTLIRMCFRVTLTWFIYSTRSALAIKRSSNLITFSTKKRCIQRRNFRKSNWYDNFMCACICIKQWTTRNT